MKVKYILIMCVSMFSMLTINADIMVSDVKAQYLHPWGKVTISYKVQGDIDESAAVVISAKDNISGEIYFASNKYLSGNIGVNEGVHRIAWDMEQQGVSINSENVCFTVAYYPRYLVIDLSAGNIATSYPVSYLHSVPSEDWTYEYKTTKLVLRFIEPGSFKMKGSYDVTLTKPYYIGVFEVTQYQYLLVTGKKPSECVGNSYPVENVSWEDIRGTKNWPKVKTVSENSFVGRLKARTGLNLDLPTNAQWEYACRAGSTTEYYWGNSMDGAYAWYKNNYWSTFYHDHLHVVGTRLPNDWGLYDMSGNVREWCLDWWNGEFSNSTDPVGPSSGSFRVICGSSWGDEASSCISSSGDHQAPSYRSSYCGFRLACSVGQ